MIKIILFSVLLFFHAVSVADGFSSPSKVIEIQTQASGNFNVIVENPPTYCNSGKFRFRSGQLSVTQDGLKTALSHIMFAYSHNKDIEVFHTTSDNNCYSSTVNSTLN